MRTIKNLSLVLMTALVAVFMTSCGGGSGPKATAKSFLDAYYNMDFEAAKQFATAGSADVLDQASTMMTQDDIPEDQIPKATVEVGDVEYSEDKEEAIVSYTVTVEEEEESNKLKLVKEEEGWKVAFDKASLMEMEGMDMDFDMDMEEEHDMEDHDHEMESDTGGSM